jgi:hypothetical protein
MWQKEEQKYWTNAQKEESKEKRNSRLMRLKTSEPVVRVVAKDETGHIPSALV